MENEELAVDPQFLKGFNEGYLLAKHEPELAALITGNQNDHNGYFKGLTGGKQEYDKEVREWAKGFSKGTPAKDERGIDKAR